MEGRWRGMVVYLLGGCLCRHAVLLNVFNYEIFGMELWYLMKKWLEKRVSNYLQLMRPWAIMTKAMVDLKL